MINKKHKKCIGVLTIGQTPRPDLISPLEKMLPNYQVLQAGALDGVTADELPEPSDTGYPLETQMRNGQKVQLAESYLTPRLQKALDSLEASGIYATLLLCAGTFADLTGKYPLFVPFRIGRRILNAMNIESIGLITPIWRQERPIRERWKNLGWQAMVWTADLGMQDVIFHQKLNERIKRYKLDCIVLDYVGHPQEQVTQLQKATDIPVIDLGQLAMAALASSL